MTRKILRRVFAIFTAAINPSAARAVCNPTSEFLASPARQGLSIMKTATAQILVIIIRNDALCYKPASTITTRRRLTTERGENNLEIFYNHFFFSTTEHKNHFAFCSAGMFLKNKYFSLNMLRINLDYSLEINRKVLWLSFVALEIIIIVYEYGTPVYSLFRLCGPSLVYRELNEIQPQLNGTKVIHVIFLHE